MTKPKRGRKAKMQVEKPRWACGDYRVYATTGMDACAMVLAQRGDFVGPWRELPLSSEPTSMSGRDAGVTAARVS